MILKELYVYPDLVEHADQIVETFRDESRSICNFLERELKPLKFKTDLFKRVCVVGKSSPNPDGYLNSSNVLVVEVSFDAAAYEQFDEDEKNPFFLEMLQAGLTKAATQFELPLQSLLDGLEKFRALEFVNEWCFKKKRFRNIGIECYLNCRMTLHHFHLVLRILKGEDLLFDEEILQTPPDEIIFGPKIRDLKLDGDKLRVTDKFGDATYELDLNEIG